MNEYPAWWNETITVFNRFEDPQTQIVRWFKTTINNCFWNDIGQNILVGETRILTNDIICRIPQDDRYLDKHLWINLPNDKMSKYFTLSSEDILIRGEVEEDIDEYKSGYRSTDILAKYKEAQGCLEIKKVSNNTGKGRGIKHYHVRGV